MKTFLVLYTGQGEGCDYTIDCNKTWDFITSQNIEEAISVLMNDRVWERYQSDYEGYSKIEVFEIAQSVDLDLICKEHKAKFARNIQAHKQKQTEEAELREYKRLKEKFGEK